MSQLFQDYQKKSDDFFKDDFIAHDGFYVKVKHHNHTGTVKIQENKPELTCELKQNGTLQDTKVEGKLKLSSSGEHEITGEWDLDKFMDNTKFTHKTTFNSTNNEQNTKFSLTNEGLIKNSKLRLDMGYHHDGHWDVNVNAGHKHCDKLKAAFDFCWCGKVNKITKTNVGVKLSPTSWYLAWLTHRTSGGFDAKTNWARFGTLGWSSRFIATNNAMLRFDYNYDLANRSSSIVFGVHTQPTEGVDFKTKVHSSGEVEASGKIAIASNWHLIVSSALNGSKLTTHQQNTFGFGLEGSL